MFLAKSICLLYTKGIECVEERKIHKLFKDITKGFFIFNSEGARKMEIKSGTKRLNEIDTNNFQVKENTLWFPDYFLQISNIAQVSTTKYNKEAYPSSVVSVSRCTAAEICRSTCSLSRFSSISD